MLANLNLTRKKLIIGSLWIFSMITVFVIAFSLNPNRQTSNLALPPPTPTPFSFKAKVVYAAGLPWKIINFRRVEIKEGDILSEADEITTEKDTRLVAELDDGSIIRVGDDTRLSLSQLSPSLMIFNEKQGRLFARVTKDRAHRFIVKSGNITVESIGTEFAVASEDNDVKVQVFESSVKITDENKNETEVAEKQQWQETKNKVEVLNEKDVANDEFLLWSLKEEEASPTATMAPTSVPTPEPTKVPTVEPTKKFEQKSETKYETSQSSSGSVKSISLSVEKTGDNQAKMKWSVDGNSPMGFKTSWSQNPNPEYPPRDGDEWHYLNGSETREDNVTGLESGKTWHFRVCEYLGGKCGVYSGDVSVGF